MSQVAGKEEIKLKRGLKNRHIQMIALGGAIGTGLFYGSAESIALVGPAILLAYLLGGFIIYLIMTMMGEMSTHEPVAGAFSHFSYKYWGEFPGFLAGWNYWFLYILVSMAELSVIGIYIQVWFPDIPLWVSSLTVLIIITIINLFSIRIYGEFEFWFALVKVLAIILLIALGAYLILTGTDGASIANLWQHGGFFPYGIKEFLLSLVIVMFSFGGTELIGITAGEADDPKKSIPKAIKQVIWRILLFYILSIAVLMILHPWNEIGTDGSPFVIIFKEMGFGIVNTPLGEINIPATFFNIVVLSAAISVYNSGIYSNGRMLFGLAEQGNAPKLFMKLNRNSAPVVAILFSSLCTLIAVVINFLVPEGAFMRIMSLAVAAATITWGLIVIVQYKFRKQVDEKSLTFKVPFYPISNFIALAFLALLLVMMTQSGNMVYAVIVIPIWIIVLYIGFRVKKRLEKH
ncbi:amino acid permease [Ignatzschineria cameli]|uniref:Aromatic amino acid transporter AroP n=2 Tax=Bacteria TaxID=2 RepID=A0A2U2ATC0_9GAMM|nr:amino acid permease [Ignatzschineria cameli]PWD87971.1 aromatic amino acid transporter AroP [Ignatzschineria cameli]PWD91003.1 aromatic amino acid transporter AroP [Ignatzschineria cameli]PWD92645.1 aromatic amino acid transporter AroP [Ignatzschineria cameli]PWD93665.1 aromatic amino acid transporter AroP [Ignatzschineria cameli]